MWTPSRQAAKSTSTSCDGGGGGGGSGSGGERLIMFQLYIFAKRICGGGSHLSIGSRRRHLKDAPMDSTTSFQHLPQASSSFDGKFVSPRHVDVQVLLHLSNSTRRPKGIRLNRLSRYRQSVLRLFHALAGWGRGEGTKAQLRVTKKAVSLLALSLACK